MSLEETLNDTPTTPTEESGTAEQHPTAQTTHTSTHPTSAEPVAAAKPRSEKEPSMEDFATALETFEQEQAQTEAALNDEQIVTGTVLKITPQYVVVDIGYKSEGVVPVAEFTDSEGNVSVQPGEEIPVVRDQGHTEEGYINLSYHKAQRLRAWDEIEKAYNDKAPVKARIIDRIKGGLTVDILGARAFLPGSQVDLRPVRNLDSLKGHRSRSPHHQAEQEARQHRGFAQATAGRRAGRKAHQDSGAVAAKTRS